MKTADQELERELRRAAETSDTTGSTVSSEVRARRLSAMTAAFGDGDDDAEALIPDTAAATPRPTGLLSRITRWYALLGTAGKVVIGTAAAATATGGAYVVKHEVDAHRHRTTVTRHHAPRHHRPKHRHAPSSDSWGVPYGGARSAGAGRAATTTPAPPASTDNPRCPGKTNIPSRGPGGGGAAAATGTCTTDGAGGVTTDHAPVDPTTTTTDPPPEDPDGSGGGTSTTPEETGPGWESGSTTMTTTPETTPETTP